LDQSSSAGLKHLTSGTLKVMVVMVVMVLERCSSTCRLRDHADDDAVKYLGVIA